MPKPYKNKMSLMIDGRLTPCTIETLYAVQKFYYRVSCKEFHKCWSFSSLRAMGEHIDTIYVYGINTIKEKRKNG